METPRNPTVAEVVDETIKVPSTNATTPVSDGNGAAKTPSVPNESGLPMLLMKLFNFFLSIKNVLAQGLSYAQLGAVLLTSYMLFTSTNFSFGGLATTVSWFKLGTIVSLIGVIRVIGFFQSLIAPFLDAPANVAPPQPATADDGATTKENNAQLNPFGMPIMEVTPQMEQEANETLSRAKQAFVAMITPIVQDLMAPVAPGENSFSKLAARLATNLNIKMIEGAPSTSTSGDNARVVDVTHLVDESDNFRSTAPIPTPGSETELDWVTQMPTHSEAPSRAMSSTSDNSSVVKDGVSTSGDLSSIYSSPAVEEAPKEDVKVVPTGAAVTV